MLHFEVPLVRSLVRAEVAGRRPCNLCCVVTLYCQLLANTGWSALT